MKLPPNQMSGRQLQALFELALRAQRQGGPAAVARTAIST